VVVDYNRMLPIFAINNCVAHLLTSRAYILKKKSSNLTQQSYKSQRQIPSTLRSFSSTAASSSGGGGAGLFARVGSFISGAGLTALATEIYIFKEVREGNLEMLKKQRELEKRLAALEKKKH